jgi:hypothetical protein
MFLWMVFVLAGCESPFAPRTLVERLRILGLKAEPPEVGPFDEVALEVLLADPAGEGRPVECTWAVCLVQLEYVATDIQCPGPDSYPLEGDCRSSVLSMPDLIQWLAEQGFDLDQLPEDLPEGFDVADLPLYVGFEATAGEERTNAIKRIRINLTGEELNINPVLLGAELDGIPLRDGVNQVVMGTEVELNPLADEGTRQTYKREDDEEDRLEDFLFNWYSTRGKFKDRRTILDIDSNGEPMEPNQWELTDEEYTSPGPATVWLVIRDGRYGTDWKEFQFEILPSGE